MNLLNLSFEELMVLKNDVAMAIANFEKRKKEEVLAELKELARSRGFLLEDFLDNKKNKKKSVVAKFADPTNPESTWSGRGRKPKWVVEALASGRQLEDFTLK